METNKEKSKCCKCFGKSPDIISSGTGKIDGHICFCLCHKHLEPQVDNQQEIREEFIDVFCDNFVVQVDDPYEISDWWLNKLSQAIEQAKQEEHQFFLNILDGIDEADRQMQNKGGGTKAIRLALQSRII